MRRELAAGIAATLLFFLSALLIPMVGVFAGVLTPSPTLLAYYRWGAPHGYWIPAGAGLFGCLLLWYLNLTATIPYLWVLLILGLLLGVGMRYGWSAERTIGGGALLAFLLGFAVLWLSRGGMGGDFFQYLEGDMRAAIGEALNLYGMESVERQILEQSLYGIVPTMVRLLPGVALSFMLIASWLNILLTGRYCKRHHLAMPGWVEWSRWRAPEHLVWGVIASGIVLLLPTGAMKLVGLNALMVLGTIYLFQGLSVVTFYCERFKLPLILRTILYCILLLQQFVTLGTMILGLFDMWFDFRRLSRPAAMDDDE